MGNELNSPLNHDVLIEEYLKSPLSPKSLLYDSHFGEIYVQSGYFIKQLTYQDSNSFERSRLKMEKTQKLTHLNLLGLLKVKTFKTNQFCTNLLKMSLLFEHLQRDLSGEIRNRRLQGKNFTFEEIITFIKGITSVLGFLQRNGVLLGNLRTSSILVDSNGVFRVFNGDLWDQEDNLGLVLMNSNENRCNGVYLAPELMEKLRNHRFTKENAVYKGEIFTLGMIIMEMIFLKTMDALYDYNKGIFKGELLKEMLNQAKTKVPHEIAHFLEVSLTEKEKNRPDCEQIDFLVKELLQKDQLKKGCFIKEENERIITPLLENNKIPLINEQTNNNKDPLLQTYPDGSFYKGDFYKGFRHGKGFFQYADGGAYEGEWFQGQMQGFGVLFYPNKEKAYEGEWLEDKFHGKGVIYNENLDLDPDLVINYKNFESIKENWIKYEGSFEMDNKNGYGILYLKNGSRFEGNFEGDRIDGIGRFFFKDKGDFKGEWLNNKLIKLF